MRKRTYTLELTEQSMGIHQDRTMAAHTQTVVFQNLNIGAAFIKVEISILSPLYENLLDLSKSNTDSKFKITIEEI